MNGRPFGALRPGRPAGGWSFIDLLAALAIVALLLTLAVPSYRQHVQRAHRAEAVQALLRIAACQERVRADTGAYDSTHCLERTPAARYRFRILPGEAPVSAVFEAIAEPLVPSVTDDCGSLGIDQAGTRTIGGDERYLEACWSGR